MRRLFAIPNSYCVVRTVCVGIVYGGASVAVELSRKEQW